MLSLVPPVELTANDFAAIAAADMAELGFNRLQPAEVVRRLWEGSLFLYRIADRGVMVVEINEGGDGTKRLNLVRMAGSGLTLNFEQISKDLQHIARDRGCVAIETMVNNEKLAKALTRGGAKLESYTMVVELENG